MTGWDVIVVGSGPGGAVVADRLTAQGARVLVLEEGPRIGPGEVGDFSPEQMRRAYRGGGLTGAVGRPAVAYAEARCVGGGSEVNAGLYHRPPRELLERWRAVAVPDLDLDEVEQACRRVEADLAVTARPGGPAPAGLVLARGAQRLGWAWEDVPRWLGGDHPQARRGMSSTLLARAEAAGAVVRAGHQVVAVRHERGRATGVRVRHQDGTVVDLPARTVVVCAGAIGSPVLLRRSGLLRGPVRLGMHPMAKVVARFDEDVNTVPEVAAVQVREFAPRMTFGSSASSPGMLAVGMLRTAEGAARVREQAPRLASYYAALSPLSRARILRAPLGGEPLVALHLARQDREALLQGLSRLTHLLLGAGATWVVPAADGAVAVRRAVDVHDLRAEDLDLMSVHLMASLPLGGPLDGRGALRGTSGVHVADASVLPTPAGVNPQGTVMVLAHRVADAVIRTGGS